MSAHDCQTCAEDSQSHRNPSTYSPGKRCSGTRSWSYVVTLVSLSAGCRQEIGASGRLSNVAAGLDKGYRGASSKSRGKFGRVTCHSPEQSPWSSQCSGGCKLNGSWQGGSNQRLGGLEKRPFLTTAQPGIGFICHVEPAGNVPSDTKVLRLRGVRACSVSDRIEWHSNNNNNNNQGQSSHGGALESRRTYELSPITVPLPSISFEFPAKGIGVCWKHSSVKSEWSGQSRYW